MLTRATTLAHVVGGIVSVLSFVVDRRIALRPV